VQDGSGADPNEHDVAIVVVGETPYAESEGYDDDLTLDNEDQTTINNVKASGEHNPEDQ
jgi:beta-glucosidase